jgi:plasmid maintenance system antidote protein VapI
MGMGERLTERYKVGVAAAIATMGDVARGVGRHYRTVQNYLRDERRVTEAAAANLVRYLRDRAQQLTEAAEELDAALKGEEGSDE